MVAVALHQLTVHLGLTARVVVAAAAVKMETEMVGRGGDVVVILKYPYTLTITIGGGLVTPSPATVTAGGFSVTTFTGGTDNVQFN